MVDSFRPPIGRPQVAILCPPHPVTTTDLSLLPHWYKTGTLSAMTPEERLQQMIEDLRRLRMQCEPKSNQNPRYLRYSTAVSALRWIIDDLAKDSTTRRQDD